MLDYSEGEAYSHADTRYFWLQRFLAVGSIGLKRDLSSNFCNLSVGVAKLGKSTTMRI